MGNDCPSGGTFPSRHHLQRPSLLDAGMCAVARLAVPAARFLVIEDSVRGLCAAKAAGLACGVIPSGLTAGGSFGAADAARPDLAPRPRACSRAAEDGSSPRRRATEHR